MRIVVKQIILESRAEFGRGYIEVYGEKDFCKLFIQAKPEDYDYSNWHKNDLKDLADAIYAVLGLSPKEATGGK